MSATSLQGKRVEPRIRITPVMENRPVWRKLWDILLAPKKTREKKDDS